MMRLRFIRTWSGPAKSHRTLLMETKRRNVFVWFHRFERGWYYADAGMLCFGCGWISVNAFTSKAQ
jgi:hypothetical protein